MSLLAISWEPEIRGILTVVIAVVILMGSLYMILATNLGTRLGFLVSLAALFGWLTLMGIVWWIYGLGLKGPDASWAPVPGETVIQDTSALRNAEVLQTFPAIPDDATFVEQAELVNQEFLNEGWQLLDSASPSFGQAQAAAAVFLEEEGAFETGTFVIEKIYDTGGKRYPLLFNNQSLDFLAFFHDAHYVVAEAAPLEQVRAEAGRAPVTPQIDNTRQRQYVYMIRDAGGKRHPSIVLALGGGTIFLALCWLLHRRDLIMRENLAKAKAVATA